ncbi:hypothetical protein BZG36_00681 [Bifiguratus adelaidae]|uniref:Ribosomal protein S2 n=1 Tax=Bifiguratus adelaidae TaxID=1938954 RepID=A0A261Y6R4_9FUNG|nr:hypothetical protein BZG36_00681 [Bifiguratus adelaidae]
MLRLTLGRRWLTASATRHSLQPKVTEQLAQLVPETSLKPIHARPTQTTSPSDLTISKLLAAGLHLGHSTSQWNPTTLPYMYGTRQGISIINLEQTLTHLRRACQVVRDISYRGGNVLFIGTRPGIGQAMVRAAQHCEGYHVSTKWVPGTLTNAAQVLGRHSTDSDDLFKPDVMVIMNPMENEIALSEAVLHHIPTIALVDSNYDPRKVTFPIPANDDSIRGVELLARVLSEAAREGLVQRKHAMDLAEKANRKPVEKRPNKTYKK